MSQTGQQTGIARNKGLAGALVGYAVFAAYLSWPHWGSWSLSERTLPVCWCIGAVGAYFLSRRWIRSVVGGFFSGALYSFGPLALYTTRFHETGACIVAVVPWLFCAWAYTHWLVSRKRLWTRRIVGGGLFALPFVFVAVLFRILAQYHLFVMPLHVGYLTENECMGVIVPMVMAKHGDLFWGVYHVALGMLALGVYQLVKAKAWRLIGALGMTVIVAVWQPWPQIFQVCPLVWWLFPHVFLCICVGLGIVFLLKGTKHLRHWVLGTGVGLVSLGVLNLLQSAEYFQLFLWFGDSYARLFVTSGKLYVLGAVGFGLIYVLMATKKWHWGRIGLVCIVLSCDLVVSASYIVDRLLS